MRALSLRPSPDRKVQRESVVASISALNREMGVLTGLRIRELITDEEFLERRNGLNMRRLSLTQNLARIREPSEWIEPPPEGRKTEHCSQKTVRPEGAKPMQFTVVHYYHRRSNLFGERRPGVC